MRYTQEWERGGGVYSFLFIKKQINKNHFTSAREMNGVKMTYFKKNI